MEDKATQRALEKYPFMPDDGKEGLEALKYIGMECECASVFNEVQEAKQSYFIEGYHQAEKDLELSLEDIKLLDKILINEKIMSGLILGKKKYEEILKRFKDYKEI